MKLLSTTTNLTVLALSFITTKGRLGESPRRNLISTDNRNIKETETLTCVLSSIAGLPIPSQAQIQEKYICTTDDKQVILLSDDPHDTLGEDFISGVTKVSISIQKESIEEERRSQVNLKDSLILESFDSKNNEERRDLEVIKPIIDVKKVLVVRVVSKDGAFKPTQSEEDLFDDIFDDDNNMAVRFDECSNGHLQMIPAFGPGVTNGVTTVSIEGDLTTKDHLYCMEKAISAIDTTIGNIIRDFTMIICPDVIDFENAAAYAMKPGNYTWFLSKFASIPLVQAHEIAHNFGLEHSVGLDGLSSTDPTCNLGTSGSWTDQGDHYCWNAAKTWAWHWYDDYHAEVDPLSNIYNNTLVGINAVLGNTTADHDVVLKITSTGSEDLYLIYQRQVDANRDIPAYGNHVVITEQANEMNSQSYMKMAMLEGDEYTQDNWGGIIGNTLTIKVCSLDSKSLPGSGHVIVYDSTHKISCPPPITVGNDITTPSVDELPPKPPSLPLCQDAAGRIKYKDTTRNCLFLSRKNTTTRCANDGVATACPVTCMKYSGYQCQCEERPLLKEFSIVINGVRTQKTCQDAIDDSSLCDLNKVRSFCPIVCKVETCI